MGSLISEQDFDTIWKAKAHSSSELFTYDQVRNQDCRNVWTIVEGEDNSWYAQAGYHVVNALGYVLTEKPWETGLEEAMWFEDDFDEEEDES